MPMREATVRCGTMWPVRMVGKPGMVTSHLCVEVIVRPSGRFILIGFDVVRLFLTEFVSITKMDVAPVSAMAWLDAMREGCALSYVVVFIALFATILSVLKSISL